MTGKERLEAYLRWNEVPYLLKHHPKAFTAKEVAASEHISNWIMAKVVMVMADGKLVMTVLSANQMVDLKKLAQALDASVIRLAEEAEFQEVFFDCEPGAMPPFGNLYNLPVYVDRALAEEEYIVFQAGTHRDTMRMTYTSFARLVKPVLADFKTEDMSWLVGVAAFETDW